MQNIVALAVLVLVAHVARAADYVEDSYAPHVTAADSDACEAKAQTVSACPDLKAEPCEDFWQAFEACMVAVENAGPTR